MPGMRRKRLVVSGRVQGVGFRYYIIRLAESFTVTGYVRNQPNGGVEIVAEGDEDQVEAFIGRAALGPSSSRVSEVKTYQEQFSGGYDSFGIQY
jgi:acylphosphatase